MNTITFVVGSSTEAGFDWAELRGWGTLVAAVLAATIAYGAFRREQRRDRIGAEIRNRDQASKFAGWVNPDHKVLYLKNASDLPIENVVVHFWNSGSIADVSFEQIDGYRTYTHPGRVVAPGETVEIHIDRHPVGKMFQLRYSMTFSDAQGILWARHHRSLMPNPLAAGQQPAWYRAFATESRSPFQVLSGVLRDVKSIGGRLRERITSARKARIDDREN